MGCVSSKLVAREIEQENQHRRNVDYTHHVVSLTSSTYGVLNLDKDKQNQPQKQEPEPEPKQSSIKESIVVEVKKSSPPRDEPSEIINEWELMEGLEEGAPASSVQSKRSPKSRLFLRGFGDMDSPLKFLNQMGSPRKAAKKAGGKENKVIRVNGGTRSLDNSPKPVLKECNFLKENVKKPSPRLWASIKGSPNVKRCDSSRIDSDVVFSKRKSLGPVFGSADQLVAEGEEEMKKMVFSISSNRAQQNAKNSDDNSKAILDLYKKKCPPGGENSVVIYTTTLRGIRKTFEDCNMARSIIESQNVQMFERDISMHSGFKEELRGLVGCKEVRVPLVFVKGRLIGGADEMLKLDDEGRLGILLDGIPKAGPRCCEGCSGIRFLMCVNCNGSCRVLGEDGKKSVKCSKCNENGLIQCPICC